MVRQCSLAWTMLFPQLYGNFISNARYGANDPADSINLATSSTVTGCSITSNVATCTTTNPNAYTIGESVYIGNMSALTYLNQPIN